MPVPPPPYRPVRDGDSADDDPRALVSDSADGNSSVVDESPRVGHDDPTRASPTSSAATPADLEGARIEGYQVSEEIHRGGQGVVYRATQLGTKRQVALKVLLEGPFAGESTRQRFEREVELAASLRHPNIVTILDSGVSFGRYFCAMEYVDGLRLDRYLAKVRPPLRETLHLFTTICDAVNFAHQRGVIHRDLKPPNILVDPDGQPHVLDFGLAKTVRQAAADQPTLQVLSNAGELLGTVAYMSPEQTVSAADVDVRSDVYSLGVVFYEALLGRLPYSVDGPLAEVLTRIAHADPQPPRTARRQSRFGQLVDDDLETILLKALEKEPERRYQTAGEMGRDLYHLLHGEPIEAKRASGLYVLRKTLARYRIQAGVASVVLLGLILLMVAFAFMWVSERDAKRLADQEMQAAQEHAIEARRARDDLARALTQQTIQRGELAQARGDLVGARDFYWDAYERWDPSERTRSPAALWALRQYYLVTGDAGETNLYAGGGPSALSPDVRLAAVCDAGDGIKICRADTGRDFGWVRTPGTVSILNIDDAGTVCAAGPGWARLWKAGLVAPEVAAELPDGFRPVAVFAVSGGRRLVLVGPDELLCFGGREGKRLGTTRTLATPAGRPDYSPSLDQIAIPTKAGVQRVVVGEGGALHSTLIGPADQSVDGVHYVGEQILAACADGLFAARSAADAPSWTRVSNVVEQADWFDAVDGSGVAVFGRRDGQVVLTSRDSQEKAWQPQMGELADARLAEDGHTVVTLDPRGTLTRWTPPLLRQADREIVAKAPQSWACAEDGSSVMLADDRQRVSIYTPQRSRTPDSFSARGPLSLIPGRGPDELLMAVSSQGTHAVVCTGSMVRLREADAASVVSTWDDAKFPTLREVAITGDGRLLALAAQTPAGDRQQVDFRTWPTPLSSDRAGGVSELLAASGAPHEFAGSAIRQIGFLPHSQRLLVARSNGDLLWLEPQGEPNGPAALATTAWTRLPSPPVTFAFDRGGERVAVACEDGFVRVLSTGAGEALTQLHAGPAVRTLGFDPTGQVLLVSTSDGEISLYELQTSERVAQLAAAGSPFAMWIGNSDALLLTAGDKVREHLYRDTDALIARNRAYARQRAVCRALEAGTLDAAWAATGDLAAIDAELARGAQEAVLVAALHRSSEAVSPDWIKTVLARAIPSTWLRVGHAAYAGERFDTARECLQRGVELAGEVDADTALCLAQCDYLARAFEQAAERFGEWLQRPDRDAAAIPTVQLQQVAALVMASQLDEARAVARQIGTVGNESPRWNPVAVASAQDISRYLTAAETENLMGLGEGLLAASSALLRQFAEGSLRYHDDALFFSGELARKRGDRQTAISQYQGCIDIARDVWPSNWARYRLSQLSRGNS